MKTTTGSSKFGVGFRAEHYAWVTSHRPSQVDVFEIVSENFLGIGGRARVFLDKLRAHYPLLMHGVGLSIGSVEPLNQHYLKQLKELADRIDPIFISDHLCWTAWHKHNTHDLLPVAYTRENLNLIVSRLHEVQEFIGRRFYLENPSTYVVFDSWDFSEVEFYAELIKRSGAGILLDVNNLYVNRTNLGRDPHAFLEFLKQGDIGYLHLAGYSDQGDVLIDTHDAAVSDEVWALYEQVTSRFPDAPTIIEWDAKIPDFERLVEECDRARIHHAIHVNPERSKMESVVPKRESPPISLMYEELYRELIKPYGISEDLGALRYLAQDRPVPLHVGLKVYNHAYFLRLHEVLEDGFPLLAAASESAGFKHIVAAYLEAKPPSAPSVRYLGAGLSEFLRETDSVGYDFGVDLAFLGDLAAVEYAYSEAYVAQDPVALVTLNDLSTLPPDEWPTLTLRIGEWVKLVRCTHDLRPILVALRTEADPPYPVHSPHALLIYREDSIVKEEDLSEPQAEFLEALILGKNFAEATLALQRASGFTEEPSEQSALEAAKLLGSWCQRGFFEKP